MIGWIITKKRLPPIGKWVLVYCDESANGYGTSVFIARYGYTSQFLEELFLVESQSGDVYTQTLILGWIDIPEFYIDDIDVPKETSKRYEIMDFST